MILHRKTILFVGLFLASASLAQAAIMSAETRAKNLADIRGVVINDVRPLSEEIVSTAPSPFVPDSGETIVVEEEVEIVLTEDELLAELSKYINPTGIFMFGGEFYLIFKEKKLKVGSELGIKFNGANYSVMITEITGSTYKVRRGDSELQLKLK